MPQNQYLRVRVQGDPLTRGHQYGEQAQQQIHRSITGYREMFATADVTWEQAQTIAAKYLPSMESLGARYAEEMRGIAAGAGVDFEDILAINIRSEILQAAKATASAECSGVVVLPSRSSTGHTYIAQNWDNAPHTGETVVVLEVERDDGPDFVTVVEGGLLAKSGLNSAGVGTGTNALITEHDAARPDGIPLHVLLRRLLDSESVAEAAGIIQNGPRACSANYLVASSAGEAIDIETAPGGADTQWSLEPRDGILLHTNHFTASGFAMTDVLARDVPDTQVRLDRITAYFDGRDDIDHTTIQEALSDHGDFPRSVCCHQDPEVADPQAVTKASVVMDLDSHELWLADGLPCETGYRRIEHSLTRV